MTAHVAWCRTQIKRFDTIPVLWDFGTHSRVYWESFTQPYDVDVAEWTAKWTADEAAQATRRGMSRAA